MKKFRTEERATRIATLALLLLLEGIIPAMTGAAAPHSAPASLPEKYEHWLEEEVVYIITPKEKDVFLQLNTDKDRDLFIKAFWKQRDPIPLTDRNEFKEEHYRRIEYANSHFQRGTPLPGWKTDRGRIYIILGPPRNIDSFEDSSSVYPTIVWFYQGMSRYGLPDAFNVVFFKRRGTGGYELYSPVLDGPQSLLANMPVTQTDYRVAYRELLRTAPALARVSLNLIPGDPSSSGSPSMASDRLLNSLSSVPRKNVKDEYAQKLLLYKDSIEVEYSTNYIPNDHRVSISRDRSGVFFVNYLFELPPLSMDFLENRYVTRISVNGTVWGSGGNMIFQHQKDSSLQLAMDQHEKIKGRKFSFQDAFPLVEGRYRLSLLLKNEASKEFTSLEKDIVIPSASSLQLSDILLSYKKEEKPEENAKKAFRIAGTQFYPAAQNYFIPADTLAVTFQIFGLTGALRREGSARITFIKDGLEFRTEEKALAGHGTKECFIAEFPLHDFPPARYEIRVSVLDRTKKEILSKEAPFFVSPVASLPRPWINAAVLPPAGDPYYSYLLGGQLMNKNDIPGAKAYFEAAYEANPESIAYASSYGEVLFRAEEYAAVKEVLRPLLESENYGVLDLLARSHHATGEFETALGYYKDFLSHYGTSYPVLTLIGDCYYRLGEKEEALRAWEKSLELNPEQAKIRELVDSLKKK